MSLKEEEFSGKVILYLFKKLSSRLLVNGHIRKRCTKLSLLIKGGLKHLQKLQFVSIASRWANLSFVRKIFWRDLYRKSLKWFSRYDLFQYDSTKFKHSGLGILVLVIVEKVETIANLLGQSPKYLALSITVRKSLEPRLIFFKNSEIPFPSEGVSVP
jgi:hypothetical protein